MPEQFPPLTPTKARRKWLAIIFGADHSGDPATIPNRFNAERYEAMIRFEQQQTAATMEWCARSFRSPTGRWQDIPDAEHKGQFKSIFVDLANEENDDHLRELMYPQLIKATISDFLNPFSKDDDDE